MSPPPPPPIPHPTMSDPHMLEANGRYQTKPTATWFIIFLNVVNTLTQFLIGAVAFSTFSYANLISRGSSFSQHIYLCVIGYVILMSQAILSFDPHAGWAHGLKYPHKKIAHAAMQIAGSIFAIAGSLVIIVDMERNFQTAHGITGLIALLFTVLSLIGGVLSFFSGQNEAVLVKTLHTCLGGLTMTVAFVSLCLAFNDRYKFSFGNINASLSISFTVLALIGILISGSSRAVCRFLS